MKKLVKTKILATLGPATDSLEKMTELIDAGVDAFRLNFSHGNYDYFEKILERIESVCVDKKFPISIVMDLQGPKIRIGKLSEPEIKICKDELIEITTDDFEGTKEKISTSYKSLPEDASVGDKILIDDGLIHLKVKQINKNSVICSIVEGGVLKPNKGMNLPGMKLSTPALTDKDMKDLEFILKHRVDYIALSFVRKAEDINHLKDWLNSKGFIKPVIAKIEKPEAVENFEEILEAADAIMVARGDLGVEMDAYEVPIIQKKIIHRCVEIGKPVITATQMLESMIHNPVATRAEASDVANAVLDGTSVVMLSGETSVGKFPIEAVKFMHNILQNVESEKYPIQKYQFETPQNKIDNLFDATGKAIADIGDQTNAAAIVVATINGRKASVISKYRPDAPIVAVSSNLETLAKLNLYRGIYPYFLDGIEDEKIYFEKAKELLKKNSLLTKGDVVLLTSGAPISETERRGVFDFLIVK